MNAMTDDLHEPNAMQDAWSELGRRQLDCALATACAFFKGMEAVRKMQLQAAHATRARHETAQRRLHDAKDVPELAAVQRDLLRFDAEGSARYWQELLEAAFKTQAEMLGCVHSLLNGEAEPAPPNPFQFAMPNGSPLATWLANGWGAGEQPAANQDPPPRSWTRRSPRSTAHA